MSPIKGMSESVILPRLGKIRLGVKKQNEQGVWYPVPTDYFVCPDEVKEVLGEKPKQLRIMFPNEDREQWASQYLRRYSPSLRLLCHGDGEKATTRVDTPDIHCGARSSSHTEEIPCNRLTCEHYLKGDCSPIMNLQFLLRDCPMGFGVWQLDTGSFYSMQAINSALTFMQGVSPRLSMIPLSLQLVEKTVEPENWPKTIHVLRLTWTQSLAEIQQYAKIPPGEALLVPPPDNEPPDDAAVAAEPLTDSKADDAARNQARLLELWARAKAKIWHYDVREDQLARWFDRTYHIAVNSEDFELPVPPSKLTAEMLSFFCDTADRVCGG